MYRTIFSHVAEYKKQAVLCPLSIVGEVIMEVTIPLVTARMIDNGIKAGNISYVTGMGILMVCMALVSLFFGALAGRLSVAADPPVLILDEATSSIDTRTEAMIEKGMDSLMDGRTVFVIAHRLSTVCNSNAIMVLEHGRIIEQGDHFRLIAKHGKYYQLYTGMFELS